MAISAQANTVINVQSPFRPSHNRVEMVGVNVFCGIANVAAEIIGSVYRFSPPFWAGCAPLPDPSFAFLFGHLATARFSVAGFYPVGGSDGRFSAIALKKPKRLAVFVVFRMSCNRNKHSETLTGYISGLIACWVYGAGAALAIAFAQITGWDDRGGTAIAHAFPSYLTSVAASKLSNGDKLSKSLPSEV